MKIHDLNLVELRSKLDSRELSSEEVTRAYLERIDNTNQAINSFITICHDTALAEARAADGRQDQEGQTQEGSLRQGGLQGPLRPLRRE